MATSLHSLSNASCAQALQSLVDLPDELLLHILYFLDIPELLSISRVSHHLRTLSVDPLLHRVRLRSSQARVHHLLIRRPPLHALQPPNATIYLTRTHVAARRLHWSLVCIRLNRSLSRRPKLSTLISANILPKECCKYDRRSGEVIWGQGVAGTIVQAKRSVERARLRDELRVWLERKAKEIRARQQDAVGGVGVLVWRFSRKLKLGDGRKNGDAWPERPKRDLVPRLKRFFDSMSGDNAASVSG